LANASPRRRWAAATGAGAALLAAPLLLGSTPALASSGAPSPQSLVTAAEQVAPGSTGPAVVVLQHTLEDWGLDAPADGTFTAATAQLVAQAVGELGLEVSDLGTQLALIGFGPRAVPLGPGDIGPEVAALQRALTRAGDGVGATGTFGPQTESEVLAFQEAHGLQPTGTITLWNVESGAAGDAAPGPGAQAPAPPGALAPSRAAVVQTAMGLIGRPYAWGGAGPTGFDCSGLVRYVFGSAAALWLPHSSYLQWLWGRPVPSGMLQPGDLVFFDTDGAGPSHVGVYVGGPDQQFVDATEPGRGVVLNSLEDPYWFWHYVGGRDVLGD
jgi:cell wall-associated NlpC family hydrolase